MAARQQRSRQRQYDAGRPVPDEAQLEDSLQPQPEHREEQLHDPGLGDLSKRDWFAVVKRAAKEMSDDDMTMYGKALAFRAAEHRHRPDAWRRRSGTASPGQGTLAGSNV